MEADNGLFDFLGGLVLGGLLMFFVTFVSMEHFYVGDPSSTPREATLPHSCRPGDRVLMTTAPKAEYYECEAHWVRK